MEIFYADVHLELCFEAGTELFVVTAVVGVVSKAVLVHESDFALQLPSSIWRPIWRFGARLELMAMLLYIKY